MGPLLHRSLVLAQRFTPRGFTSAIRLRRQQLPRLVCRQCQFVVLRQQPYSIGTEKTPPSPTGDDNSKILQADGESKAAEDVKGFPESTPAAAAAGTATPNSTQIDFTKLPSTIDDRRMEISKRLSKAMNDLQGAFFVAGKRLNEVTGYAGIEQMKKAIEAQEDHVRDSRATVRAAKEAYQRAINCRSASQREVNELLQRKNSWLPSDLERFASLYRSDHANEQEEAAAQERLARAERIADEAQSLLTKNILTRYHEEQIWSDKIRSASTWVTWALMGFNVFLFVVVQLGLEPWRRRRLVGGFEEKVREVIQEETLRSVLLRLEAPQQMRSGPVIEEKEAEKEVKLGTIPSTEPDAKVQVLENPTLTVIEEQVVVNEEGGGETQAEALAIEGEMWRQEEEIPRTKTVQDNAAYLKEQINELFSKQVILVRRIDLTRVAVQSAAAGAIITGVIAFLWNR